MHRKRLIWRLYLPVLCLTLLPLVGMGLYATYTTSRLFEEEKAYDLERITYLIEDRLIEEIESGNRARVDTLCKGLGVDSLVRITVVLPNGEVMGESQDQPSLMVNHLDRPEIEDALAGRVGRSLRFSDTLRTNMLYVARALHQEGAVIGVLRVSLPMTGIRDAQRGIRISLFFGGLLIAMIVTWAAVKIFKRFIQPLHALREGALRLTRGEVDVRFPLAETKEVHDLSVVLNAMADAMTQRIEQEQRQRVRTQAILTAMSDGVIAVDSEDRVILMNSAAGQMCHSDPTAVTGRLLQEVVRNSSLDALIRQAKSSSEIMTKEVTIMGPENRRIIGCCSGLNDLQGQRIGALLVLKDITRLRQLEAIAHDFAANVSHELKTPVTSILGFIETLLDGVYRDPEKAERFLRIAHRQAMRLESIIEDLLTLSRIDAQEGRACISTEAVSIEELISSAVEVGSLRSDYDASGILVECEPGLQARLNAPLMEQALVNLIDNALKYGASERPIEVRAERRGDDVAISVHDYGCGIDPRHHSRIFERFYRVDRNRSRKEGGTGLGLSIVDHIVRIHGGRVELTSAQGKGSVFTLHIPISWIPNQPAIPG